MYGVLLEEKGDSDLELICNKLTVEDLVKSVRDGLGLEEIKDRTKTKKTNAQKSKGKLRSQPSLKLLPGGLKSSS